MKNNSQRSRTGRKMSSRGRTGNGGYRKGGSLSSSSPIGGGSSYRGGFPDRSRVKLVYMTTDVITTTNAPGSYVWAGNDVFDPDVTSAGAQPVNYDDFAIQYNRYRVWGSKVSVRCISNVSQCDVVLTARHNSTALSTTTFITSQAMPYTNPGYVGSNGIHGANGIGTQFKSMELSTPKFLGLNHTAFQGNDDLSAIISASPSHRWFWILSSWHADRSTSASLFFTVTVEYDVEFWDRIETNLDLKSKIERLLTFKVDRKGSDEGRDSSTSSKQQEVTEFEMVQSTRLPGPPTLFRQSAYAVPKRGTNQSSG